LRVPKSSGVGRAGQLFEIQDGDRSALVTEEGAGLFRVSWEGAELLAAAHDDGYGADGCHGQLLVPWPGRVTGGGYSFEGEAYQLTIDEPAKNAAIHGLARWLSWSPKEHGEASITMGARLLGHPGYPFCLELEQAYAWSAAGLEVAFSATNIGTGTAPFGYGCHPYFTVGTDSVDDGVLWVPAGQYLQKGENLQPLLPAEPVAGTPYDFREPRRVGEVHLDTTYLDLVKDSEGRTTASFASPDGATSVTCTYGPSVNFVQVYSGDTLKVDKRQALAIEPYTCAPNAFNNGLGLISLRPGETARVDWVLSASVRREPAAR
jgi:aldose 1-epimerase